MTEEEQIMFLFDIKCTSTVDCPNSIFDGCGDTYHGSYLGYTYHSKWVGINGRFTTITSPDGERVAQCRDGLWFTHPNCPAFLYPLGDEYRRREAERAAEVAEERAAEEAIRRDRDELDRVLKSYHGTRLIKHLANIGKSRLAYLVR